MTPLETEANPNIWVGPLRWGRPRSADDFNEVPVEEIGLAFILVSNLVKDYLENPSSPDPEMIKILVNSIEKNSVH